MRIGHVLDCRMNHSVDSTLRLTTRPLLAREMHISSHTPARWNSCQSSSGEEVKFSIDGFNFRELFCQVCVPRNPSRAPPWALCVPLPAMVICGLSSCNIYCQLVRLPNSLQNRALINRQYTSSFQKSVKTFNTNIYLSQILLFKMAGP